MLLTVILKVLAIFGSFAFAQNSESADKIEQCHGHKPCHHRHSSSSSSSHHHHHHQHGCCGCPSNPSPKYKVERLMEVFNNLLRSGELVRAEQDFVINNDNYSELAIQDGPNCCLILNDYIDLFEGATTIQTFDRTVYEKHDGSIVVNETVVVVNELGTQVYHVSYKWAVTEGCNYKISFITAKTLECEGVTILGVCNP